MNAQITARTAPLSMSPAARVVWNARLANESELDARKARESAAIAARLDEKTAIAQADRATAAAEIAKFHAADALAAVALVEMEMNDYAGRAMRAIADDAQPAAALAETYENAWIAARQTAQQAALAAEMAALHANRAQCSAEDARRNEQHRRDAARREAELHDKAEAATAAAIATQAAVLKAHRALAMAAQEFTAVANASISETTPAMLQATLILQSSAIEYGLAEEKHANASADEDHAWSLVSSNRPAK